MMAQIVINIPDPIVPDLIAAFLRARPKPSSFAGSDTLWIKSFIIEDLRGIVRNGRILLNADTGGDVDTSGIS